MSRYSNTPSHLGRKLIGAVILLVLAAVIVIGILQKTTAAKPGAQNDTPATTATPPTASPPSDLPAPPAPPATVSSCHKPIDATPPTATEQGFIDLVWEYESAYLSDDVARWNVVMSKTATVRYQEGNRRPASQSPSTLTTTVIPDGSVITWKDNEAKTERTVSTIACILIKDGDHAVTLPYSVPAHYSTWVMTELGWRIDRDSY